MDHHQDTLRARRRDLSQVLRGTEGNLVKAKITSVMESSRDEIGIRIFLTTSRLISVLGRQDTARLIAYMTPYHGKEIAPFHRAGMRWNLHFDQRLYVKWTDNRRNGANWPIEQRDSAVFLYNLACFQLCWDIETLLWERRSICLRGLGAEDRDALYWDILLVLELSSFASYRFASDESAGSTSNAAARARLEQTLRDKWAQGCLASSADIAQLGEERPIHRISNWELVGLRTWEEDVPRRRPFNGRGRAMGGFVIIGARNREPEELDGGL
ncbi:unnamed protein product [Parascedosporium putredinis]|uniref:Uncharacterized protein n=1 Tax=Parascedosporium putredinis TaxID=1442378 RepID=A0A9P1H7B0_9PEZI|nr:unnamed protein product [Parascedosporium putredinis]CAI7999681.1 unnamed protein product [Parascedosporium putredinis]